MKSNLVRAVFGTGLLSFGGDISSFAGQSGELRFQGGGWLDDIQFSTQPVPEPSRLAFVALGLAAFGACHIRHQRRTGTS